jgi:hypothetical protein
MTLRLNIHALFLRKQDNHGFQTKECRDLTHKPNKIIKSIFSVSSYLTQNTLSVITRYELYIHHNSKLHSNIYIPDLSQIIKSFNGIIIICASCYIS